MITVTTASTVAMMPKMKVHVVSETGEEEDIVVEVDNVSLLEGLKLKVVKLECGKE